MIKQNIDLIIVALLTLSIVMYDMMLDFLLTALHLLFEMLHLGFEWFEFGIEHSVQHLFHLSRHGSQIVTFYILMAIAGGLAYWFWKALPVGLQKTRQTLISAWERRKSKLSVYWLSLTVGNKVRLCSTALGIAYLASFLMM